VRPHKYPPPEQVTALPGTDSLELTCTVECHPACTVHWWKNGEQIAGGDDATDGPLEEDGGGPEDDTAALCQDYEVTQSKGDSDDIAEVMEAVADERDSLVADIEEELMTLAAAEVFLITNTTTAGLFTVQPTLTSPGDPELNLFPTVTSVLSLDLSNLTSEDLVDLQLANLSCLAGENRVGPSVFASAQFSIEYMPRDLVVSSLSVELVEGTSASAAAVLCTASGNPEPEVAWSRLGEIVTQEQLLQFPDPVDRSAAGEYTCRAENPHGYLEQVVQVEVLFTPQCSIVKEFDDKKLKLKLICTAEGNPQDYVFWWEKENITFEGQAEGEDSNSVRLQIIYETIGVYTCHVRNSVGPGQPCTIEIDGTIFFLREESTIIAAVVAVVFILLLVLLIVLHRSKPKPANDKDDKAPHPDQSFYEDSAQAKKVARDKPLSVCTCQLRISYIGNKPIHYSLSVTIIKNKLSN